MTDLRRISNQLHRLGSIQAEVLKSAHKAQNTNAWSWAEIKDNNPFKFQLDRITFLMNRLKDKREKLWEKKNATNL